MNVIEIWKEYEIGQLLSFEQPTPYIVESTNYNDLYKTPVLTAGKSFVIGYTNEISGIYDKLPVIIYDDFTTSTQYVNFPFKVKSSAMKILTAKESLVLPKFIYYRMQIINFDHGTHKRYWIQHYSKTKVRIPSLQEQNRIVSRIEELFSELDKSLETLQILNQQLAVYRQAVYSSAFDGINDMCLITNHFEITGGLTKNQKRSVLAIKLPYLRVANVYYDSVVLADIAEIGVSEADIRRTSLKRNDLLIVEGNGSKSQIGRIAIWDGSIDNCVHQNHIIKGRPNGSMNPFYAMYYLISRNGRKQIEAIAKSTSGLYTLSTNKIKNLKVPYCSLAMQQEAVNEISTRLSICNDIEQTVNTALTQAAALRQSILKHAFEGRLL